MSETLNLWRRVHADVGQPDSKAFVGCAPKTNGMTAIVDTMDIDGQRWRHLSVSRRSRTPTHEDMMVAREAFLDPSHVSMAIYPPKVEWVNLHEYCLHIWQPIGFDPVKDPHGERARAVGLMTPAEHAQWQAYKQARGIR